MTKLLGDKPFQAPTNADLGDLAYQDGANAVIGPIAVSGDSVDVNGAVTASTSLTTPLVTNADTLALSATGANIVTASTNGVERLRVTSAGNVGVGTSSPATALDVSGTANATNITRGGSQVFSRDNILGTVSQSAGVPTGAIIERGSNANGEFVRYADGTQICNVRIEIVPVANTVTSGSATLPAAFVAGYDPNDAATSGYTAVAATHVNVAAITRPAVVEAVNSTATSVTINIIRSNTTSTNNSVMCIGRWF